ncbi:hypothetical protein NliqN6_0033 [Naganishia liquefaciens]|uniref:Uncharacterized protein n=1 Tax=Naganishia liquefaciens TaxID=104408 RepID=A0A8H3TMW3_9TREE|nr:hypothetical protein NliqN6_0033 [Naganishia liquefaciens]
MLSLQTIPFPAPVPSQDEWDSRRNATDHRTFRTLDAPVAAWRRTQAFERFLIAHPPREPEFDIERLPLYGRLWGVRPVQSSTDGPAEATLVQHLRELRVDEAMATNRPVVLSLQVHGDARISGEFKASSTAKPTHLAPSSDISRSSSFTPTKTPNLLPPDTPRLDAAQEAELDITLVAPTPTNSPVLRAQAPVFTPRTAMEVTRGSTLRRSNAIKRGSRHMWHLERLPEYLDEE